MTEGTGDHDDLDELAELRALAARLDLDAAEGWEQPPDDLFARIAGEAGLGGEPEPLRPPTPLPIRDRRRAPGVGWLLGAAAAVAVVVGAVVVADDGDRSDVVASVALDRLGEAGSGRAELVEVDGNLRLRIDTEGLDAGDGFLEVWVIDPDVTQLVSLGPLRPDGLYDLPPGLDPAAFPVVDVSVEPLDGDPTHSGDSVLRGQLEL